MGSEARRSRGEAAAEGAAVRVVNVGRRLRGDWGIGECCVCIDGDAIEGTIRSDELGFL